MRLWPAEGNENRRAATSDKRGKNTRYTLVSGPALSAQAAIDAVRWWQYRVTDDAVEVDTEIEVIFPQ
jgi:hypothetical protein